MSFLLLAIAIIAEVFGSTMLKASAGFKRALPSIGVVVGYMAAFYTLSIVLKTVALGTAYAIWAGAGTALTAIVGMTLYKESKDRNKISGIALITLGVILLNMGSGGN